MRNNFIYLWALALLITTACNQASDDASEQVSKEVKKVVDLKAVVKMTPTAQGPSYDYANSEFTKFSFAKGSTTTDAKKWDIAFRSTTIIVNAGENSGTPNEPDRDPNSKAGGYVYTGSFASLKTVEDSKLKKDTKSVFAIPHGSGNGWYNYNRTTHAITPIPGKVLVFRTHEGKYAKVEILSYYKGNPEKIDKNSKGQYYTFNYVYLENGKDF